VGAFANTKGGNIFIGVSDKGKVIGVRLTKETKQLGESNCSKHRSSNDA